MKKNNKITIFTMSDGSGHTAEQVALSAIRQFLPYSNIDQEGLPRIVNTQQISQIFSVINHYKPCLVAYTLVKPEFKEKIIKESQKYNIPIVDIINPLIDKISELTNNKPRLEVGLNQKIDDNYFKRIEAIEFAIKFDDGKNPKDIISADIILIGVSRTSKTPTCLYLAQNKGLKAGNIPILKNVAPPKELFNIPSNKIIGLTIKPEVLLEIRKSRLNSLGLPIDSEYANYESICEELEYSEDIMNKINCLKIDVTNKAIEETASDILILLGKSKIY
ncbi:MAG: putative pyruvate, phosphate dikinase regulatory protein [Candidatus Sericytochromatia bacterium]|nr:MAG: putative pyruvate, phosphate dikinase regulatory protein [Candidatus Sericytochromatia bacterium]